MKFNFYLANTDAEETSVYLFIRSGATMKGVRNTIKINTGFRIKPKYWNKDQQQVRRGTSGEAQINAGLSKARTAALLVHNRLLTEGRKVSMEQLEKEIRAELSGKIIDERPGFWTALDAFTATKETDRSRSTVHKYRNLKRLLLEYCEKKRETITFDTIDEVFYEKLKYYFVKEVVVEVSQSGEKKRGYVNTTSNKNFKLLKSFLSWAVKRGLTENKKYLDFEYMQEHEPDVIYLEQDELFKILYLDFNTGSRINQTVEAYERARDLFCFACFTGQRWSDIERISWDQIKGNTWTLLQEKTGTEVRVELNEFALDILGKYKNEPYPLPKVSGQKVNDHIKEIARIAGVNETVSKTVNKGKERVKETGPKYEFISFHDARATFITNSLMNGMRIESVMKITGHRDYKAMRPYIKITEKHTANEMNRVWNKKNMNILKVV